MLNIKWGNGVTGYLSESEKELCEKIDREISAINAISKTEISVVTLVGKTFNYDEDPEDILPESVIDFAEKWILGNL